MTRRWRVPIAVTRRWRVPGWIAGLVALGWLAGFAWFLHLAANEPVPAGPADGIVVLTGGADRVGTALQLLADGRAPRLLISGVARGTDLGELARRAGLAPEPIAARVTLGRAATSTQGNAAETAAWVVTNHVHTLIVVTAGYHMPRALLELSSALPGVVLLPTPVQPPAMRGHAEPGTWRLLASEYNKWLAVRLGVAQFWRDQA